MSSTKYYSDPFNSVHYYVLQLDAYIYNLRNLASITEKT